MSDNEPKELPSQQSPVSLEGESQRTGNPVDNGAPTPSSSPNSERLRKPNFFLRFIDRFRQPWSSRRGSEQESIVRWEEVPARELARLLRTTLEETVLQTFSASVGYDEMIDSSAPNIAKMRERLIREKAKADRQALNQLARLRRALEIWPAKLPISDKYSDPQDDPKAPRKLRKTIALDQIPGVEEVKLSVGGK